MYPDTASLLILVVNLFLIVLLQLHFPLLSPLRGLSGGGGIKIKIRRMADGFHPALAPTYTNVFGNSSRHIPHGSSKNGTSTSGISGDDCEYSCSSTISASD